MPSSLIEIVDAMAESLEQVKANVPDLQVYPFLNPNPTPPSIDIFPADDFQLGLAFGQENHEADCYFTVRARTTTADSEAGQRALLNMLDRTSGASVENGLTLDQTLGGRVQSCAVAEVSGYRVYLEDAQGNGSLIGCEWRVEVLT